MSAASTRRPRAVLGALILVALALAGCTGSGGDDATDPAGAVPPIEHATVPGITHLHPEEPAADFALKTIDGDTIHLSDLRGQVVLIEFMGAGCGACLRNLPDHKRLYEDFAADEGFAFLAVDVWGRETEDDLREYRDEHEIRWPMGLDPGDVERTWGVRGTPTQFFIDHEGFAHGRGSVLSYDSMATEVTYLLDERLKAQAA